MTPEMKFVKFLGKGSYGSVDLFRYTQDDGSRFYTAVKISDDQRHESVDREFRIMLELKGCPRIVQLFGNTLLQGIDSNGKRVYKLPMEYAAAGNLTSFIKRNNGKLSDSIIKDFTRMILQGLVSIHSHGYVHCDLKPDNLLLFPRYDEETWNCAYELKISDFGLSIKAGEDSDCWEIDSPFVGTPIYMSPESVDDGSVEKTLDLWSLGCVVLEMYTGKQPWLGVNTNDLESLLADGNAPKIPENVPCDARKFLETCFARKREDRGTASELLLHPFLIGEEMKQGMVLRSRKLPGKSKDITKKPLKSKIISSRPPQFKKISNKSLRVKILPPRPPISSFVPIQ